MSFGVLVGYWAAVLSFQPFMITAGMIPLLIMGRIAPGLFIKHKVLGKVTKGTYRVLKETSEQHVVQSRSYLCYYRYNRKQIAFLSSLKLHKLLRL